MEPQHVRTIVTLDLALRQDAARFSADRGISFRQGLNELIRLGLQSEQRSAAPDTFRIRPRRLNLRPGLSYDNIEELLEIAEGPRHL